jgi:hypothetical protein
MANNTSTLLKQGQDPSSMPLNRPEGKGPGVRTSTLQKEPGSTNLNYLQQQ